MAGSDNGDKFKLPQGFVWAALAGLLGFEANSQIASNREAAAFNQRLISMEDNIERIRGFVLDQNETIAALRERVAALEAGEK